MSSTGVVLYPNIDFLPKAASRFHVTQPIEVAGMHGEEEPGLRFLCMRLALKFSSLRTPSFRDDDDIQLFRAYGGATRGKSISKQRISKWLVKTIKCVYAAHDVEAPQGIKAHQTRKCAVSYCGDGWRGSQAHL